MTKTIPLPIALSYMDQFEKFIDKNGDQTTLDTWFEDQHVEDLRDYQSIGLRFSRMLKPINSYQEKLELQSHFTKQENKWFDLGLNAQYVATIF